MVAADRKKNFGSILKGDSGFVLLVVLIFLCVGIANVLTHEMWRDELQVWSIVTHSQSIGQLFENLRYEGHPSLWYVCLYVFSRFTHNPVMMQFFHLAIATGTVYLVARYSPFSRLQKVLFAFGYYPVYEYSAISRLYAPGVFLIFCFCVLFRRDTRHFFWRCCILFLLAQSNVYGLIVACGFGAVLFGEFFIGKHFPKRFSQRMWFAAGVLIFIGGIGISVIQLIPPADGGFASEWYLTFEGGRLLETLSTVCNGYLPLSEPGRQYGFWNIAVFGVEGAMGPVVLKSLVSILLLCFIVFLFIRRPMAIFLFGFSTLGLLLFSYIKLMGLLRHHGYLYIVLVASLWMQHYCQELQLRSRLAGRVSDFCERYKSAFFVMLLGVHVFAGLAASGTDWFYPFSASRAAAGFIKDRQLDRMFIVGHEDYAASAIAGYLDRRIYYLRGERPGSFIVWDRQRTEIDLEGVSEQIGRLLSENTDGVLLIFNHELESIGGPIVKIAEFSESITDDEQFYLYLLWYGDFVRDDR